MAWPLYTSWRLGTAARNKAYMTKANMSRGYDPIIPSRYAALNQLPKLTDDLVEILRKNNLPEKEIEYRA